METERTNIVFVLNPIAGGGRAADPMVAAVHEIFQETGVSYELVTTRQKGDGVALAQRAAERRASMVVAIGGDGTVNEVATGLIGTPTALGIIPVGSGNGLARGLRIPLNYWDACRLILRGERIAMDVGQVCGRYFFATSGVGFDAHVGKVYNEQPGHGRGLLPYFQFAITEFFNYEPQEVRLTFHGRTSRHLPLVLTVANVEQYGGGAIIAPDAVPDDGLFDVVIVPQSHPFQILTQLPKLFNGTVDTFPHFECHKTNALTITRNEPGPAHVDGEPFNAPEELEYTLLPQALQVQVHEKSFGLAALTRAQLPPADATLEYVANALEKLAQLKEKGILTEDEFMVQKQRLLERL